MGDLEVLAEEVDVPVVLVEVGLVVAVADVPAVLVEVVKVLVQEVEVAVVQDLAVVMALLEICAVIAVHAVTLLLVRAEHVGLVQVIIVGIFVTKNHRHQDKPLSDY